MNRWTTSAISALTLLAATGCVAAPYPYYNPPPQAYSCYAGYPCPYPDNSYVFGYYNYPYPYYYDHHYYHWGYWHGRDRRRWGGHWEHHH